MNFITDISTLNKRKYINSFLSDLCDTFSLKDLIISLTCVKSSIGNLSDFLLTNKPKRFHNTSAIETS